MARKKPTGDDCAPFAAGEQPQAKAAKKKDADFGALVLAQAQEQGSAMQAAVMANSSQPKQVARYLYWQGWRPKLIAEKLGVPATTLYGWRDAEEWDKFTPLDRVNGALELRMVHAHHERREDGRRLQGN